MALKRAAPKKRPRKAKAGTRGLLAKDSFVQEEGFEKDIRERISGEGGVVLAAYKDPLGGNPLILAILPLDKVEPTPFQRDVSDMHHKRLADVLDKTGYFLDPIIAITAPEKGFWSPNGGHRLAAMRRLGAKAITALGGPQREPAWQIPALHTQKGHKPQEKTPQGNPLLRKPREE